MVPEERHPLRDKGLLTRLMILRELGREEGLTMRQVADRLGVTAQAVSEHIKRLVADGHVIVEGDGPRLTPLGVAHLERNLFAIKDYVDRAVRDLRRVDACGAVAGATVQKGDRVGLFMERGELYAYPERESPSTGVAEQDAETGQDLAVGGLEGIVHLDPGRVVIGLLPDATEGGSRKLDRERLTEALRGIDVVVPRGPVARSVTATLEGVTASLFGGAAAAAEAALKGADVLVLLEAWEAADFEARFFIARDEWGLSVEAERMDLRG